MQRHTEVIIEVVIVYNPVRTKYIVQQQVTWRGNLFLTFNVPRLSELIKNKHVIYRWGRAILEISFPSISKTSLGLRRRAFFETSGNLFPVWPSQTLYYICRIWTSQNMNGLTIPHEIQQLQLSQLFLSKNFSWSKICCQMPDPIKCCYEAIIL